MKKYFFNRFFLLAGLSVLFSFILVQVSKNALASFQFGASNSARMPARFFTGVWQGRRIRIWNVRNVTVEKLPDAKKVGILRNFIAHEPRTARPPFYLLDHETINVWVAPREFPGKYVVHNGMQGQQKTYGTWVFKR